MLVELDVKSWSMTHQLSLTTFTRHALTLILGLAMVFPVCADTNIVGDWASVSRSKGGIGTIWIFESNGKLTQIASAIVDFSYRTDDGHIIMVPRINDRVANDPPILNSFEFSEDVKTLTLSPDGTSNKKVLQRVGAVVDDTKPIVGEWSFTHDSGALASMRFSRRGEVQLRVLLKSTSGAYSFTDGKLTATLPGRSVMEFSVESKGDRISLQGNQGPSLQLVKFRY
jgi:hypothetical protein